MMKSFPFFISLLKLKVNKEGNMKKIFLLIPIFLLGVHCQVNTQKTARLEVDNPPLNSENLKHGWADASHFPETKTFRKDAQSLSESVERGRQLYLHHCQQCHGPKGDGQGELAETLKLKPSDLRKLSPKIPHSYLVIQIDNGKKSMPSWKNLLTSKQTWDLTQYILTFSQK
jgi:mono/diheme cytochrome c family protein